MGEKEAKVTIMVLKVDLDCQKCYRKVKKVLCKYPQIRDQVFNEKQNTVTIKVVCCSPEKIMGKLSSKGGGSIKSIEIKEPEKKPKEAEKPKETAEKKPKQVTFAEVPKHSDKKKESEKAKEADKPKDAEKKKELPKEAEKPKTSTAAPEPVKVMAAQAVQGYPSMYPVSTYYGGFSGAPSYHMHGGGGGAPQAHFIQYDGYYGRPVYDSWAGGSAGGYNYNHHSGYEENSACTIM